MLDGLVAALAGLGGKDVDEEEFEGNLKCTDEE